MYRIKKHKLTVIIASLLFLTLLIAGWQIVHQTVLFIYLVILVVIAGIALIILFENHRGVRLQLQDAQKNYRQIESLFYLYSTLRIRHPLPPMRGWAISPDFANAIVSCIIEYKPKLVLEAGSGVSTLVSAYSLQAIGEGAVISLDNEKQFAAQTRENVARHKLQDTATVIYAPLKEVAIQDKTWFWYDTERLNKLGPIDMLIIDGPPNSKQRLARYPALPILFPLLSDEAIILLDDALRADEKEIIKLWLKEFGDFSLEEFDAEKGAAILRRQRSTQPATKR